MDPLLILTNKSAGSADDEALERAVAALRAQTSVEVHATGDPGELDGVLHRAGSRRIVVAGGDGTLHAVASALYRRNQLSDAVLALLPLGTGNDFARGVGLPLDVEDAARVVLEGSVRRMDILVDELGEIVVNNVHAGAGAQPTGWKGRLGYPLGAVRSAIKPISFHLRIEVDGQVVNDLDQPVLMVAVGNGAHVGGGTPLTPHADPEHGMADVMVSRALGLAAKAGFALKLTRGDHPARDDVTYLRGRQVSISGEEFWCSADGEIYGPERQRTWTVAPAAYSMVLP